MLGWIIYEKNAAERNKDYIKRYELYAEKQGIVFQTVIANELQIGVIDDKLTVLRNKKPVEIPDFAICRCIFPMLSRQLEMMGVKVYNSSVIAEICNDKSKTYQYVAAAGVKTIDTIFAGGFNKDPVTLPAVVKSNNGHGGTEVFIAESEKELTEKTKSWESFVLQSVVSKTGKDLRVYVIGKKITAAVLRTSTGDFRANYSLGATAELYKLKLAEAKIVNRIIDLFNFGLVGIDFIIDDHGDLIFNEIEDVVGSRMLYSCSDIDIAELYIEHILADMAPARTTNN